MLKKRNRYTVLAFYFISFSILLIRNFSIEQCYWTCDENEAAQTYTCLQETDICDQKRTCADGTDEDYCDEVRFALLKL